MNSKADEIVHLALLGLIGLVVMAGVIGVCLSPANATAILSFCTMSAISLLGVMKAAGDRAAAARAAEVKASVDESAATLAAKTAEVARLAAAVKTDLATSNAAASERLESIADVAAATHTLVNNNMGVQLKMVADLSRWKANQEKTPDNERAAEVAEQAYAAHQLKQQIVDDRADSKGAKP